MSSRNFVSEHNDERRRDLHAETVVRNRGPGSPLSPSSSGAFPAASTTSADVGTDVDDKNNNNNSGNNNTTVEPPEIAVPEKAASTFRSASAMGWTTKDGAGAAADKKVVLHVGIVFVIIVVLLVMLFTITQRSGQAPAGRFPRLLFFTIDGVSVDAFRRAAVLRRVPSMDFFASQSANCRPLNQDDYFSEIDSVASAAAASSSAIFSTRFKECIMKDSASRVGTIYSLLTGTPFGDLALRNGKKPLTLDNLLKSGANFTTFLSEARDLGLISAILGSTPLLSVETPKSPADGGDNKIPVQCGILDSECIAHAMGSPNGPPACTVPASVQQSNAQMITSASSCNSAFQGLILPTDTPEQIWRRLKYVVKSQANIIYVQIPADTVNYWMSLRPNVVEAADSDEATMPATTATAAGDAAAAAAADDASVSSASASSSFALDSALYDIDGIFSKLIRTVAIQSVAQGEEWLALLSVSSPSEQEIMMASNVIDGGVRQDAGSVNEVASLTPHKLYTIISDWLRRK